MTRYLKIAVAGLGRIAWRYHIPAIIEHPRFRLIACADPLADRLAEAAKTFRIDAGYKSIPEMLEKEKPDLLLVASPTCFHAEQVVQAFRYRTDVICEKPLAGTLDEARNIYQLMHKHQRKLMVYQPHRLTPEAIALKKIIDSGVLDKIFMVRRACKNFSCRNDWQAFIAYGGGMLNNYGSHFLDQFIYLFGGDFKSIHGITKRIVSCGDAEDFVKLSLDNGQHIAFDMEINMASAFMGQEWQVYGNCGSAIYNGQGEWRLKYFLPEKFKLPDVQSGLAAKDRAYPESIKIEWLEEKIPLEPTSPSRFYDCCYDYFALDKAPLVPVEDTIEVMTILEQCRQYRSAE